MKKDYGNCVLCGAHRAQDYSIKVWARWTRGFLNYDYRLCGKCANKWVKEVDKLLEVMDAERKDPRAKRGKRFGWWRRKREGEF